MDWSSVLERCRGLRRASLVGAEPHYTSVRAGLAQFDGALAEASRGYRGMDPEEHGALKATLEALISGQRERIRARFEQLVVAQQARRRAVDDLTVMFFGKTLSGKSTTIEALRAGDGSTIGEGAPDYTRHIESFHWDGLTLVDTPGLLGFEDNLRGVAEGWVDRAEVICMVVADDPIEPILFEKMANIRGQNKRMVVLLNVKDGRNRIAGGEGHGVFDERELRQLKTNIRKRLAEHFFQYEHIPIVAFCANAAFLAHQQEDSEQRGYLWQQSRIEDVIQCLRGLIEKHGIAISATAPYDGLGFFVQTASEELEPIVGALSRQRAELQCKIQQVQKVFQRLRRDSRTDLDRLHEHFRVVEAGLGDLAWDLLRGQQVESPGSAFKRACRWSDVRKQVERFQAGVIDRVQRNLEHFRDTIQTDLCARTELTEAHEVASLYVDHSVPSSQEFRGDVARGVRVVVGPAAGAGGIWAGAEAGAAVGGLVGGPIGALIGCATGGLIGSLLTRWAVKELGQVIEEPGDVAVELEHARLKEEMTEQLWDAHRRLEEDNLAWLSRGIDEAERTLVAILQGFEDAAGKLVDAGDRLLGTLNRARHQLALGSFQVLLGAVHPAFRSGKVQLVEATRWMGYRAKLLVRSTDGQRASGLVIGRRGSAIRAVQVFVGSPIDVVEADGISLSDRMVRESLQPAKLNRARIRINNAVVVEAPMRVLKHAYGKRLRNLTLASDLIGVPIKLVPTS
ncbi:50S ribosome-binding GTPase [Desulfobulbus sp. AH-315-M07]|nr:50S ribosome-binding GTPase [Desulfobulbus sp. AH-315-M07]